MRKELRGLCGIALIVLVGTSSISSLAQQPQPQTDAGRVLGERERAMQDPKATTPLPALDRALFEREVMMQDPPLGDLIFLATEMSFGGSLVKGAPYSAQAITESTQTLSDGNRIINKSTASVYRDSEGRTRREQTLKAVGPFASGGEPAVTVFINDPVAGTSYTLDPRTLTARKMMPMRFKATATKPATGEAKTGEKEPEVRYREAQGQVIMERSSSSDDRYKIALAAAEELKKSMEAGMARRIASTRNRTARTESLGKQNVGGVEAEGTRTTVTIPAGEIGNERAIEMVSERWHSPELQVIVMTRQTDPRFGENSYQLTNISRNEPARELFEVPAGYTVTEAPAAVAMTPPAAISGGVLNGKAIQLPAPEYPPIAKQAHASGTVTIEIIIDEEGNVISASAVSGHPLLRAAAVSAARQARFSPTRLNGQAVKVSGVLAYTFAAQ